ncbi:hypothetical protein AVEN_242717-1 [Araneus ventricosus]|uniref:Peptidase aspartic putative domain-containing protein n=1 Tax=Araneus ventricosus TaxID=182803 RepID=A0A4Y2XAK6_ARAVE|nr:hypothetical protein AVEN_242717-1 [Araneus ventricosus]
MYDSGSEKSYIRKEIASVLGLAPLRQQRLSHALFGGEKINEELHNVYKIEIGSLDGNFNCNFDAVDKDIICNDVPSVSYCNVKYVNCDNDIMTSKFFTSDEIIEDKLSGANLSDGEEIIPLFFKEAMDSIEKLRTYFFLSKE